MEIVLLYLGTLMLANVMHQEVFGLVRGLLVVAKNLPLKEVELAHTYLNVEEIMNLQTKL